jgi:hypothetical protein
MNYHIIIATERRVSTEEKRRLLAVSINNDLKTQTGVNGGGRPVYSVTPRPAQLHSMGESITDLANANILYAAEWDFQTPYVNVLKGSIADLMMAYLGWPTKDKTTWEAEQPKEFLDASTK